MDAKLAEAEVPGECIFETVSFSVGRLRKQRSTDMKSRTPDFAPIWGRIELHAARTSGL
jgi:hypothetical protein